MWERSQRVPCLLKPLSKKILTKPLKICIKPLQRGEIYEWEDPNAAEIQLGFFLGPAESTKKREQINKWWKQGWERRKKAPLYMEL